MTSLIRLLFLYLVLFSGNLWAVGEFISTGHREAMMANGGATNLCSPGQFINNPAGLACPKTETFSESFGSTNFAVTKMSFDTSQVSDLQASQSQTSPGLSLFSQSLHDTYWTYGLWGTINQFTMTKAVAFNSLSNVESNMEINQTESEWHFGGFAAQYTEHLAWGVSLSFQQKEYRYINDFKGLVSGSIYQFQKNDTLGIEKSVDLQSGLIATMGDWKTALTLRPPNYHLDGNVSKETTTITTAGTFEEKSEKGKIRAYEPWTLSTASEYEFSVANSLGFDLKWKSASSISYDTVESNEERSPTLSMGVFSKWQITSKTLLLSGARWTQSIRETTSQDRFEHGLISAGILRLYKGVELGSGVAYGRYMAKKFDASTDSWVASGQMERLDFTFSSSFSY